MTHLHKIYQYHFQHSLPWLALALAIPWQAGLAATRVVDTTADNGAATACTVPTSGDCSLRGAITAAAAGDTITVPAGTYTLGGTEIPISVSLTINGAGATSTLIDGNNASRIFNINILSASPITISGVTIRRGNGSGSHGGGIYSNLAISLILNNVNVLNNTATGDGGGINVWSGSVTLTGGLIDGNTASSSSGGLNSNTLTATGTTFSNNRATGNNFGGAYAGTATLNNVTFNANQSTGPNPNGNGGGLGVSNPSTINNSIFTNNHCTTAGGAIWANNNVTVTSSTFTGNQATGTGGAIFSNTGNITLTSSTFTGNQAAHDGGLRGIWVTDTGSTFSNNVATPGNGGGIGANDGVTLTNTQLIGNSAAGTGGGVLIWTGGAATSSLQNVLLANNTAGTNGAAVYIARPTNIYHTTITSQSLNAKEAIYVTNGVAVTVKNTIITNHATGILLGAGTVTEDYNLFFGNTADRGGIAFTAGANDVTGNPLFFNSAANDYHLTVGSAAIDTGIGGLGVTTDIDGESRPYGTAPDIGYDEAIGYNLTLATDGTGTGTVSSSGTYPATSCGANCLTYLGKQVVTLTATANATNGSTFVIWTCTPAFTSGTPLTANTTCTATFNAPIPITHYHLATQTAGTGSGSVTGAGSYPEGTTITLVTTPNPGSTFAGWSTGCSNSITLTADLTCTATFNLAAPATPPPPPPLPDYLGLFLRLDGTGTGKVTTDTGLSCQSSDCQKQTDGSLLCNPQTCSQSVKTASTVTLTPQADLGSYFSSWGGHQDCLNSPILMDSGKLCIAYFHLLDEPLTVVIQGQGSVTATPLTCPGTCTATYPYNTTVTLQPQPAASWKFQAWSGDCDKNGQVLMTSTKNCGATFLLNVDEDLDHIPSAIEDAAPNHGDGNGDGILDSLQNNVSSFVDAVNGVYLTLQVDKTCPITNVYSELPDKYPGVNHNHHFPQGLTYFELSCAQTQVTVYYHRVNKVYSNLRFYKYGPTVPGDLKTVAWYKYPATFALVTIGGQPVMTTTYTLTDGQLGDSTGVDGKIVDPAGIELE